MSVAALELFGPSTIIRSAFHIELGIVQIFAADCFFGMVCSNRPPSAFAAAKEKIVLRHGSLANGIVSTGSSLGEIEKSLYPG